MDLIITEKPSVGRAIAAVLGANKHHEGYMSGHDCVVSWCIGHLVELALPEMYDEGFKRWRYRDLPILPKDWQYAVSENTDKQFEVLRRLMRDNRFSSVICATDAGREGELIFRLVYMQTGCTLPVKRLWISSMEESTIREGFNRLKDGKEYDNLYQAALCRAKADWLIGMNATRLYSLLYGPTLAIGRVMTPTLAMLAKREKAVQAFRPEAFYTVKLELPGLTAQSKRIPDQKDAERLQKACEQDKAVITAVEHVHCTEKPPSLFDLTTLQRDANRLLGFTAQQTLEYAQALYEKALLTYPRTDSRFLPEEMKAHLSECVGIAAQGIPAFEKGQFPVHPEQVIDNTKVSDHHALLPTLKSTANPSALNSMTTGELELYQLVCVRLICAVGDPCVYDEIKVTARCAGEDFTAKGKRIVQLGWKGVWNDFRASMGGRLSDDMHSEERPLSDEITKGEIFSSVTTQVSEGKTTPPPRYTEGDILHAMETAGAEERSENAEWKGIGTPATRAGILEKLIETGLIERKGERKKKVLLPTEKGLALTAVLPEQLLSARLTAEWEDRLKRIEWGVEDPETFLRDIEQLLTDLTRNVQRVPNAEALFPPLREKIAVCPKCGAAITERDLGFMCENRTCGFALWKQQGFLKASGKQLTADMVRELLAKNTIHLTGLRSPKTKAVFDADVHLTYNEKGKPALRLSFDKKKGD